MTGLIELREGKSFWKPVEPPFENRAHAGLLLGEQLLKDYGIEELKDAVVLGCPRGGMVLAQAMVEVIKREDGVPSLDLVICRKILTPENEDFGIGAVTEQGEQIFVDRLVKHYGIDITSDEMSKVIEKVKKEVQRRVEAYREGKPLISLEGKVVIIVDGISTGSTVIACVKSVRAFSEGREKRIIVATPVLAEKGRITVETLAGVPQGNICSAAVATPPQGSFWNSDDFYKLMEFTQMTDGEVRDILTAHRMEQLFIK